MIYFAYQNLLNGGNNMRWINLREEEFKGAVEVSKGVCIIPMGCVEAHGQHLPLGCDSIKAEEYAVRAAEAEPACVFPTMYFGEKSGAGEFAGTIIFPQKLIMDILEQCCKEIARNGFKKIVILNAHGGNKNVIDTFVRSILQKDYDFLVYSYYQKMPYPSVILSEIEKYPYLTEEDINVLTSYGDKHGGHGCFTETGWMYDIVPELVRLDRMAEVDGTSTHLFDDFSKYGLYTPFGWMGNYPNSFSGDMHHGMNERIARAIGEKTVAQTVDMLNFLKNETVSVDYHAKWLKKNFKK